MNGSRVTAPPRVCPCVIIHKGPGLALEFGKPNPRAYVPFRRSRWLWISFFVAKGAPQVILEMSANSGEVKPAVEKAVQEFAGRGFRSLGVARADLAGILPLFDPARVQAEATIASARQMGVNLKMITGDQTAIAKETAKQPGIGYEDPGCRRIGRYQAPRVGAVGRGHGESGRLRPSIPRAQVPHC